VPDLQARIGGIAYGKKAVIFEENGSEFSSADL